MLWTCLVVFGNNVALMGISTDANFLYDGRAMFDEFIKKDSIPRTPSKYGVNQEEMPIFWEVTTTVIVRKISYGHDSNYECLLRLSCLNLQN